MILVSMVITAIAITINNRSVYLESPSFPH